MLLIWEYSLLSISSLRSHFVICIWLRTGVTRVGVSSTPGKTKHFQTLNLSSMTMLCDCPGLVFPSFMRSTGEGSSSYCCGLALYYFSCPDHHVICIEFVCSHLRMHQHVPLPSQSCCSGIVILYSTLRCVARSAGLV